MPAGSGRLGPRGFLTEEEKANKPKVTKELLVRIFSYLKPYWFQLLLVFLIIIISSVVGLLPSIITGKIIDEGLGVSGSFIKVLQLCIAAILTLTLSQVIGVLESSINSWVSQRIVYDMKNEMFQHLQTMPHKFFTSEKQGDIITRMNSDISGVSSAISSTLTSCVSNICTVVTTVVALVSIDYKLAIIGILVIPLLVLPTKAAGQNRWKLLTEEQGKADEMNDLINESLSVSGSLLIKLFTQEDYKNKQFDKLNQQVVDLSIKGARAGRWFRVLMGIFTNIGPLLIYLAGGYIIFNLNDSSLTVGTITATVAMINRLYRPIESLLSISVDFTRSLALFSRIFDYLDMDCEIRNCSSPVKPDLTQTEIEYQNVEFYYSPDKPLIRDLTFKVPTGKMYAIVGPSGSGKSTIVNLLPRLYDTVSGSVKINGVDVRDFDISYLRDNIGVVTQEAYMFNGSIKDNLLFAKSDATDEEIIEACKIANIHDMITSLPEGYNTQCGNRGLKLSGGEKQRLSIARVILKDPKILILDEATSALDSISENAIHDALETMMQNRTSLVIAHRLSTILSADKILVVKDGVIAEEGTHEELLSLNGVYHELYETQFRQAIDYEKEHETDKIDYHALSTQYEVRRITEADIQDVYNLCKENRQYYRYAHVKPTMRNLTEVITELPDGTGMDSKYFVGFYDDNKLIAILDLIAGYPESDDAFIGWFMVDASLQNQGIGSAIFADIRAALKAQKFDYLQLGVIEGNIEAEKFWTKQGFQYTGDKVENAKYTVCKMERSI